MSEALGRPHPGKARRAPPPAAAPVAYCPLSGQSTTSSVWILSARRPVTVSGTREGRIAALASHQRGRAARSQLLAIGVSSSAIDRLVRRGTLHRTSRGVYVVGHTAPVPLGDETAALLAVGAGSALGGVSSGGLWDLITPHASDPIVVLAPHHGPAGLPGVVVHRTSILTDRDIRWREGLPVATPARTLLDLAVILSARSLELAIDRALVAGHLRVADLVELLARSRGHPGHARLAAAAAELGDEHDLTVTDSDNEERFLDIVRRAELPDPLVGERRFGYQIDFLWPEHGLAVEIDGRRVHGTTRAFHHDRRKDRDLFAHGIVVLRYPRRDLLRRPYAVGAEVAAALVRAAATRRSG